MRHTILALALVLVAGATQARAGLVTYTMTGTITSALPNYAENYPIYAQGDRISWTLQYNTSMPMYTYTTTASNASQLNFPLITSIVDRTTGSSFYVPATMYVPPYLSQAGAAAEASLNLSSGSSSSISAGQYQLGVIDPEEGYNADLALKVTGQLPTLNLANLQLNQLSINTSTSSFGYSFAADMMPGGQDSFTASVDSISAPKYGTPEPGSLTLFLLGASGLALRGVHRRLRFRLVSFLAFTGSC
jgi:hypothetical protein